MSEHGLESIAEEFATKTIRFPVWFDPAPAAH